MPGGFGDRGIEGKIIAIRYAREKRFRSSVFAWHAGAVVEYARNVAGLEGATARRLIRRHHYPVIDLLPEQKDIEDLGGTMRLGLILASLVPGSLADAML